MRKNEQHLQGLKKKMAARDERHKGKNRAPNAKRAKVPASPPPVWPGNRKSEPGKPGAPFSNHRPGAGAASGSSKAHLNRFGHPHLHLREIARRTGQPKPPRGVPHADV